MAAVNINSNWSYKKSPSVVNVSASSSSIKCSVPSDESGFFAYAKVYVTVSNINRYESITLKYSSSSNYNDATFQFGVFDSTSATSTSGKVSSHEFSSSGGTVTISGLSSLSGTKYVGFYMKGNAYFPYVGTYGRPSVKVAITSLTATEVGYTLTYNANGGSGAPSAVSGIKSTTISSTVPTKTGYDFLGWSTSSTATSASYVSGDSISLSYNVTLYAVWKKKTYAVTYNANGGSGAPSTQTKTHGETLTLSSTKPSKSETSAGSYTVTLNANGGVCYYSSLSAARTTYYTFIKWNTNSSGTGTDYDSGASYTINDALSLYAIYSSSTSTKSVTLPTPTRDGYKFMGWAEINTADSGMTGSYTPNGNVTLYAIWKPMGLVYICDGVEFSPYQVLIYDGSSWNQYIPYVYTESGWTICSG